MDDGDKTRPFDVAREGEVIRDGDVILDGDVIDLSDIGPYDTEVKSYSFSFSDFILCDSILD